VRTSLQGTHHRGQRCCGQSAATSSSEPTLELVTIGSVRIGMPGRLALRARLDSALSESIAHISATRRRRGESRRPGQGLGTCALRRSFAARRARVARRVSRPAGSPSPSCSSCSPGSGSRSGSARCDSIHRLCAYNAIIHRQAPVYIDDPSTRSSSGCVVEPAGQALGDAAQHHIRAVPDHRAERIDPPRSPCASSQSHQTPSNSPEHCGRGARTPEATVARIRLALERPTSTARTIASTGREGRVAAPQPRTTDGSDTFSCRSHS
jgi:hypothetical protein